MTVYQNISFGLSNIKESMAKYDFDAKNAARLAQILKNPADVTSVLDECRDKDGKLEEKKAILKLIDTFTLSQYTAKTLFGYHLENNPDCAPKIAELEAKAEAARKEAQTCPCAGSAASSRSGCSWTATPRSSPAASSSVWPLPGPWPLNPACSLWTSLFPTWMPS